MTAIAPNLTVLVGELVGARLIAHAGTYHIGLPCFDISTLNNFLNNTSLYLYYNILMLSLII